MKGHMEKDGFHPHTEKNGVRKSRDTSKKTQGVQVIRKERDNLAEILRNRLATFNRNHPVKTIEYGDAGGKSKGLKFSGTHSFIAGVMTRDEAIKTLEFFTTYFNALQLHDLNRKKRETSTDTRKDEFLKNQYWIEHGYINHTITGLEGSQKISGDVMVKGHIQDAINSLKKAKKFQHEQNDRLNR